ncbi:ABC transporter permease [Mycoplasmatota bacterium]|nr:ABC transporter permease [Mycoplasmatota bacterium]
METLYFIIQRMLPVAIPLLLSALAGMYSERSGIINIALEGIMLFGAFFGIYFLYIMQDSTINVHVLTIIGILVAMIAGAIYSLLLALASITLKANQVIVGTALNMFIPAVALLYTRSTFNTDSITTNIDLFIRKVPLLGDIPVIGDLFFQDTYITIYFGIVFLIISTIALYRTRFGLRLRACGEHPHAADSVGVNVYKMRYLGVIISGLLAGVSGYFYAIGINSANVSGKTGVAGFGFLALAIMIFGQWKPMRIFVLALFFGFLRTLSQSIALIPFLDALNIGDLFYDILPYVATLFVLIFTSKKSKAPKAEGIPYDKALR